MRKILVLTIFTLSMAGCGTASALTPDYPWCSQGRQEGYPGDCNYQTRAQCLASVSGRDASCGINPRVAFSQQGRARSNRY